MNTVQKDYISISTLNFLLNKNLQESFPDINFYGEITKFTDRGHVYFTIKDPENKNGAEVSAVMWKGSVEKSGFIFKENISVKCVGMPNVYANSGKLQIVIKKIFPDGEGVLKQKFEELKLKLEKEGIFDVSRKRKIPFLPKAIGVVTSATGAVIEDIMFKVRERFPSVKVYCVDVKVQGEAASSEIVEGIQTLNNLSLINGNKIEVIIVARGGGSLQDLWCFNDEKVARAVFASRIPVISAVGHEVDYTLCDFAADIRAPTPTGAAQIVVPDRIELLNIIKNLENRFLDYEKWFRNFEQKLDNFEESFENKFSNFISKKKLYLSNFEIRLKQIEPTAVLLRNQRTLEDQISKLKDSFRNIISQKQSQLDLLSKRFDKLFTQDSISLKKQRLEGLKDRLTRSIDTVINNKKNKVESLNLKLNALSPVKVLERGFSIISNQKGVINSIKSVDINEEILIRVSDGKFTANVRNL